MKKNQFQTANQVAARLRAELAPLPEDFDPCYTDDMEAEFQFYHKDPAVTAWHRLTSKYYYLWHCRLYAGYLLDELQPQSNYDKTANPHTMGKEMAYMRERYKSDIQIVMNIHSLNTNGTLSVIEPGDNKNRYTYLDWVAFLNKNSINMAHHG